MQSLRCGPGTVLCIGDEAVRLNIRCSFLKEHGHLVLSSGAAHEGIISFSKEQVDAAILEFDSQAEACLVAAELKRLRPNVPVIVLVPDDKVLPDGKMQCADIVLSSSDQRSLLRALDSLGLRLQPASETKSLPTTF